MVDKAKTPENFEEMSDEDFLKLDEEQYSGNMPEGQTLLQTTGDETHEANEAVVANDDDDDNLESDESNTSASTESDTEDESNEEETEETTSEESDSDDDDQSDDVFKSQDPPSSEQPASESEGESEEASEGSEEGTTPDEVVKNAETPAKAGYFKLPEGFDQDRMNTALDYFQKITAPFKADGRDFAVRSPEDAIRLMQQGANYSRRMQELKPMKHLSRMLEDQKLTDPEQLSFLIDLSKGNKEAIIQLLKTHNIDPMDLDLEKESGYQANNYSGSDQDNAFRDALEEAITTPEGQALVQHFSNDWDPASKAKLRENPSIIGNLLTMKQNGIYDRVVDELRYQQSMGYLNGIPFLQAFDQVGEAMKNAGVFKATETPAPKPAQQMQVRKPAPVATGGRKSTAQAKPVTNPHLSSAPPSKAVSTGKTNTEQSFDNLSDEDFLKMPPPS